MIGPRPKNNLLTLRPFHWAYVLIVVFVIGPFMFATTYSQELFDGYVRTFIGPGLQQKFGFKIEVRRMYYRNTQPLSVFVIKSLKHDGELAKLGVRNCDVPVGYFHMTDAAFYRKLERSAYQTVDIRFINCDEYQAALKSGDLNLEPHVRKIVLQTNQQRFASSAFCRDSRDGFHYLLQGSLCDFTSNRLLTNSTFRPRTRPDSLNTALLQRCATTERWPNFGLHDFRYRRSFNNWSRLRSKYRRGRCNF